MRGPPAQPTRLTDTGTTISWPDDGWYQVHSAADLSSICNGTRSCTVDPGTYLVVNHNTGMRWDVIVVAEPMSLSLDGVINGTQSGGSGISVSTKQRFSREESESSTIEGSPLTGQLVANSSDGSILTVTGAE